MLAEELVQSLGLPGDLPHLAEALTHPSFSNEQRPGRRTDNQRLEFLGDAVLGLCVSEILMDRFPAAREGELSIMRAALVNTDALAAWARSVDIGAALRVGRGADAAGERDQKNVLADAVEAIVGAVYLDCGIELARSLSAAIVAEPLDRLTSGPPIGRDPKSELQERVQAAGGPSPRYRITGTEGPPHSRLFIAVVEVGTDVMGTGMGRSKKLAEQEAARAALLPDGGPSDLSSAGLGDDAPAPLSASQPPSFDAPGNPEGATSVDSITSAVTDLLDPSSSPVKPSGAPE